MPNRVPFSKVPLTDAQGRPQGQWADSVVQGLNQSMLALSGGPQNYQVKVVDVVVPDPWVQATQQNAWAGKGGMIKYMRHYDGSVQVRGFCLGGAYGTTAFTLPLQLIPPVSLSIPAVAGGAFGYWTISASNAAFVPAVGAGTINLHVRYMPVNNRPSPLKCFPINVKTRFKTPPQAVVCIKNQRVGQVASRSVCTAMLPSWRFINSPQGPVVQLIDIPGLEYGCRQRVTVAIIGGNNGR